MYKFKLQLGDWSQDGHSMYDSNYFESNKPIEEIREIYFANCERYGKVLETMCSEYEDNTIDQEMMDKLIMIGIDVEFETYDDEGDEDKIYYVYCDAFLEMFIKFIKLDNPDLELKTVFEEVPTFHFYGRDENKRHIGCFGYGLFSN